MRSIRRKSERRPATAAVSFRKGAAENGVRRTNDVTEIMEQLPNIVRERLKVPASVGHPDADVLTAFAEQSLAERERAGVLLHLSRCADCRDVLALAVPS